jgi:hypothetical protein
MSQKADHPSGRDVGVNRLQQRLKLAVTRSSSDVSSLDVKDDGKDDVRSSVSSDDVQSIPSKPMEKKLGTMASFLARQHELDLQNCFQEMPELAQDDAFHEFVDSIARNAALGRMVRRINEFIADMSSSRILQTIPSTEDASVRIQSFLEAMHQWMDPALIPELGGDFTEDKQLQVLSGLESYLSVKLSRRMQSNLMDKQHDDALQFRIALLNAAGVSMSQFGIDDDMVEAVNKMLKCGGFELLKIDLMQSPAGKSAAILGFNQSVIDLLEGHLEDGDASVNADILLPAIIYTLVRINPPRLVSSLRFTQRFRYHGFQRAQSAYALTNLDAAVHFLMNVDLDRFSIPGELASRYPPSAMIPTSPSDIKSDFKTHQDVKTYQDVVQGIQNMTVDKKPPVKISSTIKSFMETWRSSPV